MRSRHSADSTSARLAALALPALLALGAGTAARAQDVPYENHLVGERALGLAGAFVGVADDGSAIFHNPGGTAALETSAVAGSLWAVVRGSRHVVGGYETDLGVSDLDYSQPLGLPLFLAGVLKVGPKAADGVRPHALGAALFTPLDRQYRFVNQLEAENAVDRVEVRRDDSARWIGISYGYRIRPGLAVGLSAFLASRTFRHDEVEIRARTPTAAIDADAALSSASTLQIDARHLVLRIGTLLHITHQLEAGLMFQIPGIELTGTASTEHLETRAGIDPTTIAIVSATDLDTDFAMPWEVRAGVSALQGSSTLLTLDLSLCGPAGSAADPVQLLPGDAPPIGAFAPRSVYRRAAMRAAAGFETVVGEVVPLRGGVYYGRSATAELTSRTDAYGVDRLDSLGIAFSAGVRTGGYDFSIGASAALSFGEGYALVRGVDLSAPFEYRVTDVDEAMLMVFIGGAHSAVRAIVSTLVEP